MAEPAALPYLARDLPSPSPYMHKSRDRFIAENLKRPRNEDREDGRWYYNKNIRRSPWPPALASLVSWLLIPIYAVQGLWVRGRVMRMAPAEGPREGWLGCAPGDHAAVRLLIVGDSTAASVGIDRSEDGLAAQLAKLVHEEAGRSVYWRASGHNSAIAEEVRDHVVPQIEPRDWTHVVITIGTNDTKNFHTVGRWKKGFGTLLYALHARFPGARLYWSEAVDPRDVPGLPAPLAQIMRLRRDLINAMGQELCFERDCTSVRPIPDVMPAGFCLDGFHASEEGYGHWARTIGDYVLADIAAEDAGRTHTSLQAAE